MIDWLNRTGWRQELEAFDTWMRRKKTWIENVTNNQEALLTRVQRTPDLRRDEKSMKVDWSRSQDIYYWRQCRKEGLVENERNQEKQYLIGSCQKEAESSGMIWMSDSANQKVKHKTERTESVRTVSK